MLFSSSASQVGLVFLSQQPSQRSGLGALNFYGGLENSSFPMTNGSGFQGLAWHHLLSTYV